MGLEDHLLAFAREDLDQLHPAVAEPHVRSLHTGRRPRQTRVLVAPVDLVGLGQGRSSAARRPATASTDGAAGARLGVAAHPRRSRPCSPEPQGPHGSRSRDSRSRRGFFSLASKLALKLLYPRPQLGIGWIVRSYVCEVASPRTTLRIVFFETRRSRASFLIGTPITR